MNNPLSRMQKKLNRKNNKISHIEHKNNGHNLLGFYWGYNADKHYSESSEFSNIHLINMGVSQEDALFIGLTIKEASDAQLKMLINNRTQQELGLTREEFIAEEWDRLHAVIHNININMKSGSTIAEAIPDYIVGCCAISTLVAAGEIPQNTYNGDSFMYEETV